jgi:sphingomyelin phosphodiesterase acid-like 3
VVQLAIFAHTHMDELRLLTPSSAGQASPAQKSVALKMVPSISPVDGNNPSFMVARVDPASAVMTDYHVFSASDHTGTTWADEYDYTQAYHEPAFSSAAVSNLIAGFKADPKAQSDASQAYLNNYFGKSGHLELKAFWPEYVCALQNRTPEAYRSCVCSTPSTGN